MKVKILVENTCCEGFGCEHGLSLLAEFNERNYLVDTGASGLFSENAKKMGVDLNTVDTAFLSHAHYDHSGGYNEFFEVNKHAKVFVQEASKNAYYYKILGVVKKYIGIPDDILEKYKERFEYVKGYKEPEKGVYILPHTTKNLEERGRHAHMYCVKDGKTVVDAFEHEQTVFFEEADGLVLFNSCSHAGVENIIEEVKTALPGKRIKAFFGGFHMMGALGPDSCSFTEKEVKDVAARLLSGSECTFYSGHCTGTVAYPWLKDVLGERLQPLHSGLTIEI